MSFLFRGLTRSNSINMMWMYRNQLSIAGIRSMEPFLQNANNLASLNFDENNIQSKGFNLIFRALRDSPIKCQLLLRLQQALCQALPSTPTCSQWISLPLSKINYRWRDHEKEMKLRLLQHKSSHHTRRLLCLLLCTSMSWVMVWFGSSMAASLAFSSFSLAPCSSIFAAW